MCGSTVPIYMIKNAGHLPMRKNNGEDFATLIKHAAKTARHIKEHSSDFIKNIPNCKNGDFYGDNFHSFYSTEFTLKSMVKFYDFILLRRRESYLLNNDSSSDSRTYALECPYIANIDGNDIIEVGHYFCVNDKKIQLLIDKHFLQYDKNESNKILN